MGTFGEKFEDPSRYRQMHSTIAKTWYISFDQIQKEDPLAAEYLSFMACIDRSNIPQSLLPLTGSLLQQIKAIGTLKGYAFITERQRALPGLGGEAYFDMHRLVYIMLARWLEDHGEKKGWVVKAAERLEEVLPYGGHDEKKTWSMYLPHAIYLATLEIAVDEATRASLFERIGYCQSTLGQYSEAGAMHRQALVLRERSMGNEDVLTLKSKNNFAVALGNQGKYAEAESMLRQTLMTREKTR
ncbi:uncharacterized protein PV09_09813 [Verruconis gallopava]|uniref:MalT-like TPR region domain-containing protein n=1 Tax=Verruconis gallopava TaxID=253628 RepID=A0A0D1ZV06_9PEZI|nr:uncharacterized protein PV09_09813 [Verruconis gallopava]KIV98347.1 hypothetical protein PV09_09813 [Verruconis gallopava]